MSLLCDSRYAAPALVLVSPHTATAQAQAVTKAALRRKKMLFMIDVNVIFTNIAFLFLKSRIFVVQ